MCACVRARACVRVYMYICIGYHMRGEVISVLSLEGVIYYFILIFNYYLIRIAHTQTDRGRTDFNIHWQDC